MYTSSRRDHEHNSSHTHLEESKEQVLESYEQERDLHHRTTPRWYDVPDIRKQKKSLLGQG